LWLHICNSSWHVSKLPRQAVTSCSHEYWLLPLLLLLLLLLCLSKEVGVGCGLLCAP